MTPKKRSKAKAQRGADDQADDVILLEDLAPRRDVTGGSTRIFGEDDIVGNEITEARHPGKP